MAISFIFSFFLDFAKTGTVIINGTTRVHKKPLRAAVPHTSSPSATLRLPFGSLYLILIQSPALITNKNTEKTDVMKIL
ncbi:hypothetical protein L5515_019402 [Caenorhabditis briggsae]|uniref:Secreted protein n=1 Tax=Caenorhabditis briggsae TaxID=6238 RepID=A0AAE9FPD9_CAEBR|nr:hypothetical protein L5515_019402 [Caenorhabditis briggsae]